VSTKRILSGQVPEDKRGFTVMNVSLLQHLALKCIFMQWNHALLFLTTGRVERGDNKNKKGEGLEKLITAYPAESE
jgi:hypothetical protein